jgi:outer membrane biosynthesis protein TonB
MGARDLVLKKELNNQARSLTYSPAQSPVLITADGSGKLLALVEWSGADWVLRRLQTDLEVQSDAPTAEQHIYSAPVKMSYRKQTWSIFTKDRLWDAESTIQKDIEAQPRRQIVLLAAQRVLHTELLPVDCLKSEHPLLTGIALPALLDENWVSMNIAAGLELRSRIVYVRDPEINHELSSPMLVSLVLAFFVLFGTSVMFKSQMQDVAQEKALAPVEVSAAQIEAIRQAMSEAETSPDAGAVNTTVRPEAAVAPKAVAKSETTKAVKVNPALNKLLGALSSARVATQGGSTTGATGTGVVGANLVDAKSGGSGAALSKGKGLDGVAKGHSLSGESVGRASVSWLEEEAIVDGGLDKDEIARIIRSHLGEIRYCYERQLSADPSLQGKVQVRFVIGGEGSVLERQVNQSTLSNGFVEGCILQKVSTWNFPKPKGGVKVAVTYPFLFRLSSE